MVNINTKFINKTIEYKENSIEYDLLIGLKNKILYFETPENRLMTNFLASQKSSEFLNKIRNSYLTWVDVKKIESEALDEEVLSYAYPFFEYKQESISYADTISFFKELGNFISISDNALVYVEENFGTLRVTFVNTRSFKPNVGNEFKQSTSKHVVFSLGPTLFEDFIENAFFTRYNFEEESDDFPFSIGFTRSEPKPEKSEDQLIDEETKQIVWEFENRINNLKNKNQILHLIPLLKKSLAQVSANNQINAELSLKISPENEIYVFPINKKVELNALSKTMYIFFLNQHKPIDLSRLNQYKQDILKIYKEISKLSDYSQMQATIDSVVNIESKAIYVHISRIKKAFYSILAPEFADEFIVSGSGPANRYIKLAKSKVTILVKKI